MLQPIRESSFQPMLNFIKILEEISNVHANFSVDVGDLTSGNMLNLIAFVKEKLTLKNSALYPSPPRSLQQSFPFLAVTSDAKRPSFAMNVTFLSCRLGMASEIGFKAGTIDIPREERETSLRKEESREAKKKGKGEIFPP
ncbi:hypothetical protein WN943_017519 [Citrus x changshan-huyou]